MSNFLQRNIFVETNIKIIEKYTHEIDIDNDGFISI